MPRLQRLAILTLGLGILLPTLAAADAAPRLEVATPSEDLGEVIKGTQVTHRFTLSNQGDAVLNINAVRSSCGCTVAHFDETIAPGASGEVEAVVDTGTLAGLSSTRLVVESNDPEQPSLDLTVIVSVVELLHAVPGQARYNMVQGEPAGSIGQTVFASDGFDLEVVDVDVPIRGLTATVREAAPEERQAGLEGPQWRVDLTIDSFAPVGALSGEVAVTTNHPKQPVVVIPVSGFVRPVVAVTPPFIHLPEVDVSEKPYVFTVFFQAFSTADIVVEKVETDLLGVSTQVEPVGDGHRFNIKVRMEAPIPKGKFKGKLVIHTDNPDRPRVSVPFTGTVL